MRLSERKKYIIDEMEKDGYVWLSHLNVNAQMRFRNKTKIGFKGYIKVEGLTFLTRRVADSLTLGTKERDRKRLTYKEQIEWLENQLIDLEKELYQLKGTGARKEQVRFMTDEE